MRAIRARKLLPLSREITLFPYLNEPRERASERTNERWSRVNPIPNVRLFAWPATTPNRNPEKTFSPSLAQGKCIIVSSSASSSFFFLFL